MSNTVSIDKGKCTKCGMCISDCVCKCLIFDDEKYPRMKPGAHCIACQHCLSICPKGALSYNDKNPENSEKVSTENILSLIKSRRSVRQYKDEDLSEKELQKLKDMLPFIPTGCNSHKLHFSIIEKKEVMAELKEKVNSQLLKLMDNKILSKFVKQFIPYRTYLEKGEDIVFRGAPHMIVVSSPISAPSLLQDPIIALSYFELYANSLGYGTCWCDYGEYCMKLFPELSELLEIPKGYVPVYTMLFGKPAVKYQRTPQPEPYLISEIKDLIPKESCLWCRTKRVITNFLKG